MKIPKVKSATELRSTLYKTLSEVAHGDPQVITHKRGDACVLISAEKFNALVEEKDALKEISAGIAELDAGLGIPHEDVVNALKARRAKWK
jgi:prevent-host-death family protein